jgi:hypothetical protein
MPVVQDLLASAFMIATFPVALYHSVQAALKSNVEGASEPHVRSANWYLQGGPFGDGETKKKTLKLSGSTIIDNHLLAP